MVLYDSFIICWVLVLCLLDRNLTSVKWLVYYWFFPLGAVGGKCSSNFHLEFGNGSSFVITLACNTDVQWFGDILAISSKLWMLAILSTALLLLFCLSVVIIFILKFRWCDLHINCLVKSWVNEVLHRVFQCFIWDLLGIGSYKQWKQGWLVLSLLGVLLVVLLKVAYERILRTIEELRTLYCLWSDLYWWPVF